MARKLRRKHEPIRSAGVWIGGRHVCDCEWFGNGQFAIRRLPALLRLTPAEREEAAAKVAIEAGVNHDAAWDLLFKGE